MRDAPPPTVVLQPLSPIISPAFPGGVIYLENVVDFQRPPAAPLLPAPSIITSARIFPIVFLTLLIICVGTRGFLIACAAKWSRTARPSSSTTAGTRVSRLSPTWTRHGNGGWRNHTAWGATTIPSVAFTRVNVDTPTSSTRRTV